MGQTGYLRIDPSSQVIACLLTNSPAADVLSQRLFPEIFLAYAGISMPQGPEPAAGPVEVDLRRHTGRYERTSRRFDVFVSDGTLHMISAMTGDMGRYTNDEPEELVLHPADGSGDHFVCRSHDGEPWILVTFGQLADQAPYLFTGGRITLRADSG